MGETTLAFAWESCVNHIHPHFKSKSASVLFSVMYQIPLHKPTVHYIFLLDYPKFPCDCSLLPPISFFKNENNF